MVQISHSLSAVPALLTTAWTQWTRHKSSRIGAALAYYSIFSMGPLLLIIIAVAGLALDEAAVRAQLLGELRGMLGEAGSKAIEAMLAGRGSDGAGWLSALLGLAILIFAALGVVVQLKDAMNTIWNVAEPDGAVVTWYVRTYGSAFLATLALGFLLATSLAISATLSAFAGWFGTGASSLLWVLNFAVSLAVLTVLFAALFRWFPDTAIEWRDVWPGAITSALLFNAGKSAIGWYVGSQGFESTYGAAASLVVLLVWVYYSAQIVLFGAEVSHAYAYQAGSRSGRDLNEMSRHTLEAAA